MKFLRYIFDQAWTLAGIGLVLITLSGDTRTWGIRMSLAALTLHLISILLPKEKNND
jgi:hypothetical protein